jgi:ankyrin repeat protein
VNQFGVSPLMVAAGEGQIEIYRYLIDKGAFYSDEIIHKNLDEYDGMDLASLAVLGGNLQLLEQILNSGLGANSKNLISGNNLIHYASSICRADLVDVLIKYGVPVNQKNHKGNTAAHISVKKNCLSSLRVLDGHGIDFLNRNLAGKLAVDLILAENQRGELSNFMAKRGSLGSKKSQ